MIRIAPSARELSRQLWALLGLLVAGVSKNASIYNNVQRHGLEAWRRIAEPINEDKILILQDLLPAVTNPRAASDIAGYAQALEDWETNLRLFASCADRRC